MRACVRAWHNAHALAGYRATSKVCSVRSYAIDPIQNLMAHSCAFRPYVYPSARNRAACIHRASWRRCVAAPSHHVSPAGRPYAPLHAISSYSLYVHGVKFLGGYVLQAHVKNVRSLYTYITYLHGRAWQAFHWTDPSLHPFVTQADHAAG
jgi:hypothetical protein